MRKNRVFLCNTKSVSQIVGYVLSLLLTSVVVASSLIITQAYIEENINAGAETEAQVIADKIVTALKNVYLMKSQNPEADYTTSVDIPSKLMDKYSYNIEVDDKNVHVISNSGNIHVKKSIYDISKNLNMDFKGIVTGGHSKAIITCNGSKYVYKFDFGKADSNTTKGYMKITNNCHYDYGVSWDSFNPYPYAEDIDNWRYRTIIHISTPENGFTGIDDYQVLIQLDSKNFDYSKANIDGSDLRFYQVGEADDLPYWIERWCPGESCTSRIWVKVPSIPADGCNIYMYYGNPNIQIGAIESDGDEAFEFFDDFENLGSWDAYGASSATISTENGLLRLSDISGVVADKELDLPLSYVIETKVKTTTPHNEANIFVRLNETVSIYPHQDASVFSSGYFPGWDWKNLAIKRYDDVDGWYEVFSDTNQPKMEQDTWYRLSYIINHSDDVVTRYLYSDYSVDGLTSCTYSSDLNGTHFGLCISEESQSIAYFDWVYVRKFFSTLDGKKLEDFQPVAHVGETQSLNFYWINTDDLESVDRGGLELGADFVHHPTFDVPVSFRIDSKDIAPSGGKTYSLTFTVGDKEGANDDDRIIKMEIKVSGAPTDPYPVECTCTKEEPYTKYFISGVAPKPVGLEKGTLTILFSAGRKWTISSMTIEENERTITIRGGE